MTQTATGTGTPHPFIIPLTKIDVARRLVIGTAAEEAPDKSKEIMDYASARPQFESWSKSFSQATNGLSKGNLRVMHTKQVAGRLDDISYDDVAKKVMIVAKVSDENEWQKVLDGAYTGFSIGGGYLNKWQEPGTGLTRYTPIVREISLVDNPCMTGATFAELVKADGIVEQLPLVGVARSFAQEWSDRPASFADAWEGRPHTFSDLAKSILTADWSEGAHPRGQGGKFAASHSAALHDLGAKHRSGDLTDEEHVEAIHDLVHHAEAEDAAGATRVGAASSLAQTGGFVLAAPLVQHRKKLGIDKAVQIARFGTGEAGRRNAVAQRLRSDGDLRGRLIHVSAAERTKARGFGASAGEQQHHASAALKGTVAEALVRQRSGQLDRPHDVRANGLRTLFTGAPLALAGSVLGAQSAHRNAREAAGEQVTVLQHAGAAAGDVMQLAGRVPLGSAAGAVLAVPIGFALHGRSAFTTGHALQAAGIGAKLGAAGSVAMGLPSLVRSYAARMGSKET